MHIQTGYQVYDSGLAANVFVKDVQGNPYVGQVCLPLLANARLLGLLLTKLLTKLVSAVSQCSSSRGRAW